MKINCNVTICLTTGSKLNGKKSEFTQEELEELKNSLKEYASTSDAWQISLDTDSGWVCVPGRAVLYIEIVEV